MPLPPTSLTLLLVLSAKTAKDERWGSGNVAEITGLDGWLFTQPQALSSQLRVCVCGAEGGCVHGVPKRRLTHPQL